MHTKPEKFNVFYKLFISLVIVKLYYDQHSKFSSLLAMSLNYKNRKIFFLTGFEHREIKFELDMKWHSFCDFHRVI